MTSALTMSARLYPVSGGEWECHLYMGRRVLCHRHGWSDKLAVASVAGWVCSNRCDLTLADKEDALIVLRGLCIQTGTVWIHDRIEADFNANVGLCRV